MAKNTLINVHEIVMATSDKAETARKTALMRSGHLRKIAPKIYTTNMDDEPSEIIRRHIFYLLGQLYPNAVISHRSAFEFKPTEEGDIYLTYSYTKNISLPGVTVHLIEGPAGTTNDMPFIENLYVSSNERRVLENLQKGRARNGSTSKCLSREAIEQHLEKMLQVNGESGLNEFRDKARTIATNLGMEQESNSLIRSLAPYSLPSHQTFLHQPGPLLVLPVSLTTQTGSSYSKYFTSRFVTMFLPTSTNRIRQNRNSGTSHFLRVTFPITSKVQSSR